MTLCVIVCGSAANEIGMPEYDPDNVTERLYDLRHPHLVWADRWLPDGNGLWRAGGHVLRSNWRIYRPRRTR